MDGHTISRRVPLLWLCVFVVWCSGCFTKKRPAYHFPDVVLAHPVVPQANVEMAVMEAPDIPLDVGPPPERLGAPRNPPNRPRSAPVPVPEQAPAEKVAEPIIAPGLSGQQLAAAKIETNQSLSAAESNLALTQGRQLNTAQQDLASKIRSFVDASREAMKNGDWPRARSLAKKAEVLSQQLVENQ